MDGYHYEDTICALATPPGVGAVAIVRCSGPRARTVAEKLLRDRKGRPLTMEPRRVFTGLLVDPEDERPIDEVVVHIAESYPVQVTAQVVGYLPEGCTSLGEIAQTRAGNAIGIVIATRRSGGYCVQVIELVEKWVALKGSFPPGDYVLQVNDRVRKFHVD